MHAVSEIHVASKIDSFLLDEHSPLFQEQLQAWQRQHSRGQGHKALALGVFVGSERLSKKQKNLCEDIAEENAATEERK